jgi:Legume lectin domain
MHPILFVSCLCFAAQDVPPTTFDYRDFAAHRNLNTAGDAYYAGKVLRLTAAKTMKAGAAWYGSKEPVTSGFDTTFQFRLSKQGGLGYGADGLAFVLQNSGPSAVAGRGSAGGWGVGDGQRNRHSPGIPRALAIFFDTFRNDEDHDPSDNYVGIFTNGGPREMRWPPPRLAYTPHLPVILKDGGVHTARILYRPPVLSIYLDDPVTPVLVSSVDVSLVADREGSAWVGFTASTGSGYENHDLLNWRFNATEVSSAMVSSNISFFMERCAPGRNLCTPDRAIVDENRPGHYHVVLPANVEWGASIPNPSGREVVVDNPRGTVCWDLQARGSEGCSGPDGSPEVAGPLSKDKPAGALIVKTQGGRTYFSVNDRNFTDNEGYFEFEVELK